MESKKEKIFNNCSLVSNAAVVIFGIIAIIIRLADYTAYGLGTSDTAAGAFRFFTIDGNIYCIIASAVTLAFNIISIVKKEYKNPTWAYLMKLASAVTGTIVFLVIMVSLIGNFGEAKVTGFVMFTLHVLNPVLTVLSFLVFERKTKEVKAKDIVLGALPVMIYAFFAIIFCAAKVWTGAVIPYPFLDVYKNPAWMSILYFVGIVGGAVGAAYLFNMLNTKITKKLNLNKPIDNE